VFGRESFCLDLLFLFYSQKLKAFIQGSIRIAKSNVMKPIIGKFNSSPGHVLQQPFFFLSLLDVFHF